MVILSLLSSAFLKFAKNEKSWAVAQWVTVTTCNSCNQINQDL